MNAHPNIGMKIGVLLQKKLDRSDDAPELQIFFRVKGEKRKICQKLKF